MHPYKHPPNTSMHDKKMEQKHSQHYAKHPQISKQAHAKSQLAKLLSKQPLSGMQHTQHDVCV